ncbi:glycosyltransferase [Phenylobacterium sp.]|jgi:MGT family glycosyltransferase|uniref:glycosyltransferase n=1 Tax=Phenylobacterium sp. TaxID=1871053 RepID=UPI0037842DFB
MRFLFTTFEGGGHVPPALLVARRLRERGHEVMVLSDSANREQAAASGLPFQSWRRAPNRHTAGQADDPLDEWRSRWPPAIVRRLCEAVISGPSLAYAEDALETAEVFRPDAVVSNELLFGAMAAAEARGLPLALLTANVWCFPTREDVPPFGPGFAPARGAWGRHRDESVRRLSSDWYQAGLPALNAARARLGLPAMNRTLDQLFAADFILLGVARSFDYGATAPRGFAYAGPLGAEPSWAREAEAEALLDEGRPNILISLSTTAQGQTDLLRRCVQAAVATPANVIVTLGPALDGAELPRAANLKVVKAAPHDVIVPRCRLVLTHAGHGTVIRPLMHGVPVVCVPTGRDQPENAARVAHAGAGLRLSPRASTAVIRRAIGQVLDDPRFGQAAERLGTAIRQEADGGRKAAEWLEELARQRSRMS